MYITEYKREHNWNLTFVLFSRDAASVSVFNQNALLVDDILQVNRAIEDCVVPLSQPLVTTESTLVFLSNDDAINRGSMDSAGDQTCPLLWNLFWNFSKMESVPHSNYYSQYRKLFCLHSCQSQYVWILIYDTIERNGSSSAINTAIKRTLLKKQTSLFHSFKVGAKWNNYNLRYIEINKRV